MLTKKSFCPVNGWDCPCYKKDGSCGMIDPVVECDDAAAFWDVDEDYFVWEDENGNRYDTQELLELGYHFVDGEPVWPPDEECFEPGRPVINLFELNP